MGVSLLAGLSGSAVAETRLGSDGVGGIRPSSPGRMGGGVMATMGMIGEGTVSIGARLRSVATDGIDNTSTGTAPRRQQWVVSGRR